MLKRLLIKPGILKVGKYYNVVYKGKSYRAEMNMCASCYGRIIFIIEGRCIDGWRLDEIDYNQV